LSRAEGEGCLELRDTKTQKCEKQIIQLFCDFLNELSLKTVVNETTKGQRNK
jgi:hypothetical protein